MNSGRQDRGAMKTLSYVADRSEFCSREAGFVRIQHEGKCGLTLNIATDQCDAALGPIGRTS